MTLRTRNEETKFRKNYFVARTQRTYMTFSERFDKSQRQKMLRMIYIDININNEFGVCFEI